MRPLILVSNDDSYRAAGIRALASALTSIADVVVVAPAHEQSAQSHALSLHRAIAVREIKDAPCPMYSADGTPADSVYIGLFSDLLPRRPDLVASGINSHPKCCN